MIRAPLKGLSANRERIQRLFKEGGWIVAGQVATMLGALVLVRVLTEYLQPAQYGELALGLTLSGLVNQVVMGGIGSGIGRFYSIAAEKKDLCGYLKASRRLMGYAILALGVFALILMSGLLWFGKTQWLVLVAAVLVYSLLSGVNSSLNGVQNAARQRPIVALHNGLDAWLKICLAVGVMLWLGRSSTAVVVGYSLSLVLVTLSQFLFLKRLFGHHARTTHVSGYENWTQQIWLFSWPFSTWGIFTWAQQASDRWALEAFSSTHDVGQYAVVFQLGYVPIGLVTGLAMSLLGPILYQRSGAAIDPERNASVHRLVWCIASFSLMITGFAFCFTLLFHEWLFQILVSLPFRASSNFLPWVVLAGGLFAVGQMLSLKLMSEIRAKSLIQVKIGTAMVGVGTNLLGAWLFGLAGVVVALVVFSTLYLVWMFYLAWHLPNQPIIKKKLGSSQ